MRLFSLLKCFVLQKTEKENQQCSEIRRLNCNDDALTFG